MTVELSPEEQLVERIRTAVGGGTDREIAKKLGVAPASITNWKKGEGPGRKRLKQISEKYNISLDYLLYGDISGKSNTEESNKDSNESSRYESLFKGAEKLNPEDKAKFDALIEYAEHIVAQKIKAQKNALSRSKSKKP
jgi:transcriptional regulator with XRE-family HTH domain